MAIAETKDCTTGIGLTHNNCHGIKQGSIAPCKKIKRGFCVYGSKEESYEAFKKIWQIGYGGGLPNKAMAATWTGNDNPSAWLNNFYKAYK